MPRPGRMTTERAKDFKGTLLQLVRNLGRYRLSLVTAIVFAILSTIFNIAGPKVLAKATTALATGWIAKLRGTGSIDFVYIGRILLFLLGMYLLSSAFAEKPDRLSFFICTVVQQIIAHDLFPNDLSWQECIGDQYPALRENAHRLHAAADVLHQFCCRLCVIQLVSDIIKDVVKLFFRSPGQAIVIFTVHTFPSILPSPSGHRLCVLPPHHPVPPE